MSEQKTTPKKKLGSPDHVLWDKNKANRRKVAMQEVQFAGSLGLAIKPNDPNQDLTQLVSNDDLEFLTLRYCPPGAFPTPGGKHMESHMASVGPAVLSHGMPLVHFPDAHKTFNFRLRPDTRNGRDSLHPEGDVLHATAFRREFGILNKMSSAMDKLAFCGVDGRGRPLRMPWNRKKPNGAEYKQELRVQDPMSWMPEAYVGVRAQDMETLFDHATRKKKGKLRYSCPKCRARHKPDDFKRKEFNTTFYPDGNFSAVCTRCHQRRKYSLDRDTVQEPPKRDFRVAFKEAFCRWVAEGGPIYAPAAAEYDGIQQPDNKGEKKMYAKGLNAHEFMSEEHGKFVVHLNREILVEPGVSEPGEDGGEVKRGQLIAYALCHLQHWDELASGWGKKPLADRWSNLPDLFGSKHLVGWYQRQWFDNQAVLMGDGIMAYPTKLMGAAASKVEAQGLWWDLRPAVKHWDAQSSAIVCPPIRIRQWHGFKINLPGAVRLDASVQDPRFELKPKRSTHRPRQQSKPRAKATVTA